MKSRKMPTVYLHIGDSKTGTSIIQNFLDVNRSNLFFEHECLYPNFSCSELNSGRYHNHADWYNSNINNAETFEKEIDRLADFVKSHAIRKVILSHEGWLFQNNGACTLNYIITKKHNFNIIVICYLRRIDFWIESAWKQWGLKKYISIDEFLEFQNISNRYQTILNNLIFWSECVGKENIIIRPYEKRQLVDGLVDDFLSIINIDFKSFNWTEPEKTNLALNTGFNRDVLEILHDCRVLYSDIHDNHLFNLFSDLLGDEFAKQPFEPYGLLPPKLRHEVYIKNLPYEKQIAEIFMGRKNGRIFYDPPPDLAESWQPYEDLTLEKTIPVLIKMIDELKNIQNVNTRRLDDLEHQLLNRPSFIQSIKLVIKRFYKPNKS